MGWIDELEKRTGLPPIKQVLGMMEGETGQRLQRILGRLEHLSKDSQGIAQAVELLKLVERLDQQGTLQRLDELLRDLQPIVKSKGANALLDRLDKLAPLLESLLKEA